MDNNRNTLTLSKQDMLEYGSQILNAVIEHFLTQDKKPPVAMATRVDMDKMFLEEAPEHPANAKEVLDFVLKEVMTKSTIVSHPRAYSFVPGPSNFISAMADTLATGFNTFSGGWAGSPAAAELEIVTINWLLKIFGLPTKSGGGIFTSGGSMANLTALVTARNIICGSDFSKAVIYLSDQTHSSNIKAIRVIGLKKEQIRIIPTNMEFEMAINKLKSAIAKDKLLGLKPFCVIGTAGTTNTGAIDPLDAIAKICKEEKLWFHIDAAYGGAAILSKNGKKILKGISKADSITVDPHKWFFQPYEMGCLLVRNNKNLRGTFTEKPEYLRDVEGNTSEINFYDHGIQLTRRFRALKFYMSIKTFGLNAFREAIDYNLTLAEKTEAIIRKSPNWEVITSASLAVINFRYNPINRSLTEKQLDTVNQYISGEIMKNRQALLVTTVLHEQVVLRMCLINPRTTLDDIKETLNQCSDYGMEWLEKI